MTTGNVSPTKEVASYLAQVGRTALPAEVAAKTRLHLLDTLAAMIDGAGLEAGRFAIAHAAAFGGRPEAGIPGAVFNTDPVSAAFAGAMCAHGDETDDSHLGGRFHPGCAVVPAALALAQHRASNGKQLLRAIAAGYDIGARATMALGFSAPRSGTHSTHCLGANFGAAAAAAALNDLSEIQCEHALSYAVQQASGIPYWHRDRDHIEKAFDFGGMGARNGVFAALFVGGGATAVADTLTGRHSYLSAFAENAMPGELAAELGERFEIMSASIKKWGVGSPNQAVLDALEILQEAGPIEPRLVRAIRVTMPDDRFAIVNNSSMPGVCVQHLVALALCDGGVTFASVRDHSRMRDPGVAAIRRLVQLIPSRELSAARPARQAIAEIELKDGRVLAHHTKAVLGTPQNPMSEEQVEAKAFELINGRIGGRARPLIDAVRNIENLPDIRELAALWAAS